MIDFHLKSTCQKDVISFTMVEQILHVGDNKDKQKDTTRPF